MNSGKTSQQTAR